MRLAPFYAEILGYRWSDLEEHQEVLKQAGHQAMDDWEQSQKRSSQLAPDQEGFKFEESELEFGIRNQ